MEIDMKVTVKRRFTVVVDAVKLTHLLGIYPHIKMPYFYKKDGSVEFTMNEEDTQHLMEAIFTKYELEDYDYLEGLDLETMNLAHRLDEMQWD